VYILEEQKLTKWILEHIPTKIFMKIIQLYKKAGPVPHKMNNLTRRVYITRMMNSKNYHQVHRLLVKVFQEDEPTIKDGQQLSDLSNEDIFNQILSDFSQEKVDKATLLIEEFEKRKQVEKNTKSNDRIIKLNKQREDRVSKNKKPVEERENTLIQNEALRKQNAKLSDQVTSLKKQLEVKKKQKKPKKQDQNNENEIAKLKEELTKVRSTNEEKMKKKQEGNDKYYEKLTKRINKLISDNKKFQDKVANLESHNDQLVDEITKLKTSVPLSHPKKKESESEATSTVSSKENVARSRHPFLQIGAPETINTAKFKAQYPQADILIPAIFYKPEMQAKKYNSVNEIPLVTGHEWQFYDYVSLYTEILTAGDRYALKNNPDIESVIEIKNKEDFWRQKI
jgi:myosin heavy subunit